MSKSIATIASCVVGLIVLAFAFVPEQTFNKKVVKAPDYEGYIGMSNEALLWNEAHPEDKTAWTGSMFSGMPTMMITGNVQKDGLRPVFNLISEKKLRPASYLLVSLLGAFLLMLALGLSPLLSLGGAVAISFCSYNLQIIQVGHNTKMLAIAFVPWVLATVIFTYKKALDTKATEKRKWLPWTFLGAVLFGFALGFQLKANHIQITWYLALIIAIYTIGLIIWLCLSKERLKTLGGRFLVASGLLLSIGIAGIATNACELIPLWEYTPHTTRGGSELSEGTKGGLELDYSTYWSYGWEELPNLMIPDFNGGASYGPLPRKSKTAEILKKSNKANYNNAKNHQPLYWGPQPSTAGPMYIGAISIFLFILGLMVCEGKDKWWMLIAVVLAIGLALGGNLMSLTRFFHDYVPFYNKFRASTMALVVLQFLVPMLGFLALDKILKGEVDKKSFLKKGLIAFAITGGICLIFSIFPGLAGDFKAAGDSAISEEYASALTADRKTLFRNDAFWSFALIAISFGALVWLFRKNKKEKDKYIAGGVICLLILINLFSVGKRFLNSSHFESWKNFKESLAPRDVDRKLKEDKSDYRIADLTVNVFSDSKPSFYHKNIGGYHAAKLQRYNDLITRYLNNELSHVATVLKESKTFGEFREALWPIPVLSMLNTKYFIYGDNVNPLQNPYAMGNVWFVDKGVYTSTPDDELSMIGKADVEKVAVLGPDFKNISIPENDNPEDKIALSHYSPNELVYNYISSSPRAAVFSEIYYPIGWTARLEDKTPLEIFRVDWTLRGIILPPGTHEITMRMDPPSYKTGANISLVSSILLYILLALAICGAFIAKKKV